MGHKIIIHQCPANSSVSIGKGMNRFKHKMQICTCRQHICAAAVKIIDLPAKLRYFPRNVFRKCPDTVTCNIVMNLKGSRSLTLLIPAFIIAFCHKLLMNGTDKFRRKRFSAYNIILQIIIADFLIFNFKQCSQIPGIVDHLAVLKYLTCVMNGSLRVFNNIGVICKQYSIIMKKYIQILCGANFIRYPIPAYPFIFPLQLGSRHILSLHSHILLSTLILYYKNNISGKKFTVPAPLPSSIRPGPR